ncbi:MAG: BCCT family transporter, partial [Pseudomonadota bacterium]
QLYEVINIMLTPSLALVMSILIVVLLLTFLVTSADSATLVAKIISAGGRTDETSTLHIVVWSLILLATIAALIVAGGLNAIQAAMIVGAIPFSFLMILMGIALIMSLSSGTAK